MSKIRRPRRKKVTRRAPRTLRARPVFRIVAAMHMTPLLAMRQASGLSARQIADEIGCTQQAISAFESGRTELGPEFLKKYAKLVGVSEVTMRLLHLRSRLTFHRREFKRAEAELKALASKGKKTSSAA